MKAYICSYENGRPNLGTRFYVQFNPAELSIEEAVGVEEEDGMNPFRQFLKAGGIGWQRPAASTALRGQKSRLTLSVTLFFNTLNDLCQESYEDVREYICKFYPYTNKTAQSKSMMKQIYFFWGSVAVGGILTRLHVQYTMFAPNGKPVRAQVEISIVGDYVGEEPASPKEALAEGEMKDLSGSDMVKTISDPAQWRNRLSAEGNPRL